MTGCSFWRRPLIEITLSIVIFPPTAAVSVAGLGPAATPEVEAAMKKINPKGSVNETTKRDGSYAYYLSEPIRDNDAKGIGPFLWASLEMEMLGYTTETLK